VQSTEAAATMRLVVNGVARDVPIEPERSLLTVLRDELDITGPKPGCGEGVCGACTVLIDGRAVRTCRALLREAEGRRMLTIEGLAPAGELHPMQQAFLDAGAFQCGYCTPGMILSAVSLLEATPDADEAAIRAGLQGNVCRCGTYARILTAVQAARDIPVGAGPHSSVDQDGDSDVAPASALSPAPAPSAPFAASPTELARPAAPWDLTPPEDRDWFDVLPHGLIVVTERDHSSGWSTTSGAWLHVGADGAVTAFTGKVDGGQDNRTGLSILLAEALGIPLEDVALVMGDTDLCPHDQGTFGSRSTPDAGRELAVLGRAARQVLDRLANAQGVPATSRSTTAIGDLVPGLRRVEVVNAARRRDADAVPLPAPAGRQGVARRTGRSIVTGAKRFPSDVSRPGMRHGVVLRPPAAGAALRSVAFEAVASEDVTVVRDGSFAGAVAASPDRARLALGRVKPTWDLPDEPGEDQLESHLRAHPAQAEGWEGGFHRQKGEVEPALAAAPVRVDATYRTAFIAHVPMETRAAVAEWSDDGRVTIWTGTQVPFGVREEVAAALAVPEASVRVIVPDFGGGFGGKHAGEVAVEAARLARAAGTPVKVRWSREDEFSQAYFRPAAVIDIHAGADRDGRLTAWQMTNLNSGPFGLAGPYDVPNEQLDYQPAESPLRQGSYRALAATANHFARESAMDELAAALEIDPLELRLNHLGDQRLAAAMREVARQIEWTREREHDVGLGIAGGVEKDARVATAVELRVGAARRPILTRVVVAFDCGRIVNPDALRNQIQGAMSMGLGGALFEAVHFEAGGVLTNASITDYRVPRITDLPGIEISLLDQPDVPSAGAGETPIVALAPAIANAIFDATGVRLRDLPLVPDGRIPG
jgi:nicotinate dehydrogenase subunit B